VSGSPTDHFDGRRFFNPVGANGRSFADVPRMLATRRTLWPARIPVQPERPAPLQALDDAIVTFVGHSTFLIQTSAGNILTDPMYSDRASPLPFLGPRRAREPGVRFDDLPAISVVLLSHNHYDHCDLRTLSALERRHSPVVITPLQNGPLVRSAGMRRIEELDWWQESATAPMSVTVTPAQHFSARGPFDRNEALWGGFVFSVGGRRIFFAGDSGYGPHFREVRERIGPVDLALLPIGAYEPRWFMKDIHMNPAEAVQAHLDLGARQSIGMHFGTFQLTPEGVAEPVAKLAEELEKRDVASARFRVLEFGESMRLPSTASQGRVADSPS
jgi:L-ascorbate metabolism protein UlaG (beta-lactamase superfamily)